MNENKKVVFLGIGFIILLIVIVAVYYFFIRDTGEQQPSVTPIMEDVAKEVEPEGIEDAPDETENLIQADIDESDNLVRDLAKSLTSHPKLVEWLLTDDLIRRFVAAVDNIANGQSPRKHIDFFAPEGEFEVIEREGLYIVDPKSYERYSLVADVFSSLNSHTCVNLYRRFYPVIQQAYRDLGYPDGNFHRALRSAINELLGVPIIEGDVMLEAKLLSFEMAVPELENLSPAQKHLFRMGPRNVRMIQTRLREMKSLLAFR